MADKKSANKVAKRVVVKKVSAKKTPAKKVAKKTAKRVATQSAKNHTEKRNVDLAGVRVEIDGIDRQIEALISERARWAQQVGRAKGK